MTERETLTHLIPYLKHDTNCPAREGDGDCVCGLQQAVVAAHATPPAGPVVYVARDDDGRTWIFAIPPVNRGTASSADWVVPEDMDEHALGKAYTAALAALGLAPGECKRFRLMPVEGTDG